MLGTREKQSVNLETHDWETPHHSCTYLVLHIHEETFQKEVDRLCDLKVIRQIKHSAWGAPTFIQPKKNGAARVLTGFKSWPNGLNIYHYTWGWRSQMLSPLMRLMANKVPFKYTEVDHKDCKVIEAMSRDILLHTLPFISPLTYIKMGT